MYDYMAACNADRLEKTALNYFERKFSYRELFCEIDRAAAAFCKIGISSGTVVMAFALNTPECIVSIYALNRLGAIVDLQYADSNLLNFMLTNNIWFNAVSIAKIFSGCKKLINAPKLWIVSGGYQLTPSNSDDAYENCTSLPWYNEIPSSMK